MIEYALIEILYGDTTVKGLVDKRIRPITGAQLDTRPCIYYSASDDEEINTYSGTTDYRFVSIEVQSYGDTYKECINLGKEVRRVLHGYSGTTTTVKIAPCRLTDEQDVEQGIDVGKEKPVFMRSQTYRILYKLI